MADDEAYLEVGRNNYEWTLRAFDLFTKGSLSVTVDQRDNKRSVRASGQCPRCAHDVQYEHLDDVVIPQGPTGSLGAATWTAAATVTNRGTDADTSDEDEYVNTPLLCWCDHEHPGRPKDVRGCGVIFALDIKAQR